MKARQVAIKPLILFSKSGVSWRSDRWIATAEYNADFYYNSIMAVLQYVIMVFDTKSSLPII